MKVPVYNQSAEKTGEVELNSKIFEVKPNLHVITESVRAQQNAARAGLAHSKTRGEVSGGGKKPWKQKGTGNARAGSIRSPIWRHGGVTFGPRSDRNWELRLNKKEKRAALFMSLSDKASTGHIIIIDQLILDPVKTKSFVTVLAGLKKALPDMGKKHLFVLPGGKSDLVRASRNVPSVTPMPAQNLNVVDVLKATDLVVMKDSLAVIEKTFLKSNK